MGAIDRFEDMDAWKKARELVQVIYKVTDAGVFAKDFGLRDQIRRASVSIMSNLAEGFERGGNKELLQYLAVAKASSGEVRSQLYVAWDQKYVSEEQFKVFSNQALEISRMIAGLIRYLHQSKLRGSKYRNPGA